MSRRLPNSLGALAAVLAAMALPAVSVRTGPDACRQDDGCEGASGAGEALRAAEDTVGRP